MQLGRHPTGSLPAGHGRGPGQVDRALVTGGSLMGKKKKKWEVQVQWTQYVIYEVKAESEEAVEAMDLRTIETKGFPTEEGDAGDYSIEVLGEVEEEDED